MRAAWGQRKYLALKTLLEDSEKVSFQRGFARYLFAILSTCAASPNFYDLRLSRVLAQLVEISMI